MEQTDKTIFKKVNTLEKQILFNLRGAVELLQQVQQLIDQHALIKDHPGALVEAWEALAQFNAEDFGDYECDVLASAVNRLHAFGGALYAERLTPMPLLEKDENGEEYEPDWDQYYEMKSAFSEHWLEETEPFEGAETVEELYERLQEQQRREQEEVKEQRKTAAKRKAADATAEVAALEGTA